MPLSRLKICSLLALALLVGGCGSSHSGSATTTISSAPTTGPTQTSGSPTTATGASGSTQTSPGPNPNATSTPKPKKPIEFKEGANEPEKMAVRAKETGVPVKHQYPTSLQESFTSTCTAAGASHSACECVLKKLELSQREKGYSLAELLAVDVGLRRTTYDAIANGIAGQGVQVPSDAYQFMKQCKAA
jgi:hypothetical protein